MFCCGFKSQQMGLGSQTDQNWIASDVDPEEGFRSTSMF